MSTSHRPEPPIRSYTDLVAESVLEATASSLRLSLDPLQPARQRRSSTIGSTDSRIRRRRSADALRLPAALAGETDGHVGSRNQPTTTYTAEGTTLQIAAESDGELLPPVPLRRITSADMLILDRQEASEDDDFSSDDEPFRYRPPSIASTSTSQRSSRREVQVQDWSERQSSSFVREVRIKGYQVVGAAGNGFVLYDIELDTMPPSSSAQGTTISAHKRYSAFVRLRADLLRSFPRLRPLIPRLPPKSSFAKYRPSFLEQRRQHLSYWLSCILLHPVLGGCPIVRQWILEQ